MIEARFTEVSEKKLSSYINSDKVEYEDARKVINGKDQKVLIVMYAKNFHDI